MEFKLFGSRKLFFSAYIALLSFIWTGPTNYITYRLTYSDLERGVTKEEIDQHLEEQLAEFHVGDIFEPEKIFLTGPFYYTRLWPGKELAFLIYDYRNKDKILIA